MPERKYMILIVISITLISLALVVVADTFFIYAQNETEYKAKLLGSSEVPPVNTTGAGRGTFIITNDWVWYKLNLTGITDPTMAHIHMAEKGANGTNSTIVVDLLKSLDKKPKFENTTNRMIIRGSIGPYELLGPLKNKTLTDLKSAMNNETLQVDLHTKKHPDGELRGTIRMTGGNATKQIANNTNTTLIS